MHAVGRIVWGALAMTALASGPAAAGSVDVEWDPLPGATGYRVYYGTQSGQYTQVKDAGNRTTVTLSGLTDCRDYFMAVKAYNAYGESAEYSNEVFGWARPAVTSPAPTVMQGEQLAFDLVGGNFRPGAGVTIDNPNVRFTSSTVVSCDRIQVLAVVEPTARGVRAAEIGSFAITVANPADLAGSRADAFRVSIDPERFDVNTTDASTRGRLDGRDTVWISRTFASRDGDPLFAPDHDFTGDGWVDGDDLAYLAANLGRCWSGSAWVTCSGR
jgi:hypothetical protein